MWAAVGYDSWLQRYLRSEYRCLAQSECFHFIIEQQALRSGQVEKELKEQQDIIFGLQRRYGEVLETLRQAKDDNEALRVQLQLLEGKMTPSNNVLNRHV